MIVETLVRIDSLWSKILLRIKLYIDIKYPLRSRVNTMKWHTVKLNEFKHRKEWCFADECYDIWLKIMKEYVWHKNVSYTWRLWWKCVVGVSLCKFFLLENSVTMDTGAWFHSYSIIMFKKYTERLKIVCFLIFFVEYENGLKNC